MEGGNAPLQTSAAVSKVRSKSATSPMVPPSSCLLYTSNEIRDYCILTLFLNCGLRVGELVGLNVQDVREDTIRVLGKGNKERQIYLNEACLEAIHAYLAVRQEPKEEPRLSLIHICQFPEPRPPEC